MSLDPEVKTKWVNALRSGDYEQGIEELKKLETYDVDTGDSTELLKPQYCCLGVLCEIDPRLKFDEGRGSVYLEVDEFHPGNGDIGHLPEPYLEEVGLTSDDQTKLIQMNDGYDEELNATVPENAKTFLEIADYIEESL